MVIFNYHLKVRRAAMDIVSNKKEQLNKIENGKGIQYILDEAYKILGNPILAHDMDFKLIAYTENTPTDDPIWNEYEATGTVSYDTLLFFRDECFFQMAADAKHITFLLSDQLKYGRIMGKLFVNNNIQVGCAVMVECYQPFGDGDPELFELVCNILNEELGASEYYQNHGQAFMENMIRMLIEGRIEDKGFYSPHIESIYTGLKSNLRLVVVDITLCDPSHTKLAYFRDLFKQTKPDFKYAIYAGYIVIIMSSDNKTLHVENLNKLYAQFEENNLYAGMSRAFERIYDLPQYYYEAVHTLKHELNRLTKNSVQRLFIYDDIVGLKD